MTKTTESRLRANANYDKRNPEKTKHRSYKSTAKNFIRNYASCDELKELLELINEKISKPNLFIKGLECFDCSYSLKHT